MPAASAMMNSPARVELAMIPPTVAGDQEHALRPGGAEPVIDRCLIAQVELLPSRGQDVVIPLGVQTPHQRGADEAAVAGNENPRILGHRQEVILRRDGSAPRETGTRA